MAKIIEKIVEPFKIEVGSIFRLKIKATRYITYGELKQSTVSNIKKCTVAELKGK